MKDAWLPWRACLQGDQNMIVTFVVISTIMSHKIINFIYIEIEENVFDRQRDVRTLPVSNTG